MLSLLANVTFGWRCVPVPLFTPNCPPDPGREPAAEEGRHLLHPQPGGGLGGRHTESLISLHAVLYLSSS